MTYSCICGMVVSYRIPTTRWRVFLQTTLLVHVWKWLHLGWRGKADPGHRRESQKYLLTLRSLIYVSHLVYFVPSGEGRRGDGFQLERHYWYLDSMLAKEGAASQAILKWWRKQIWPDENDATPSAQLKAPAGGYAVILARRKAAQGVQPTSTPAAQPASGPVPSSSPRPHRTSDNAVDEEDDLEDIMALKKILGKKPDTAKDALRQLKTIARSQDDLQVLQEILDSQLSQTHDSQLSQFDTHDSQVSNLDGRHKNNRTWSIISSARFCHCLKPVYIQFVPDPKMLPQDPAVPRNDTASAIIGSHSLTRCDFSLGCQFAFDMCLSLLIQQNCLKFLYVVVVQHK
ncbi:hypothetical protein SISNIDRAFT_486374 [Sistotremastrum niveocremeum HHB9708]|uniref:Uncharacterized protein n=1 Tax=Sistotremastrum niveocremeum HHB9708 TaxID=1314777 RepID=A0A164TFG7_9AGAM|nr:hypothetical protein SISNIDRAFT_486374 [Sistotremastrum niveocremeum HHB9708]